MQAFLKKKEELFSSCHLELLAIVKAKALSFLEQQQKKKVKNHYLRRSLSLFEEEKKMEMASSKGDMASTA